jgi:type IV pilus assembly protein PilC
MPLYNYNAVALDGSKVKGKVEAVDAAHLSILLRENGLFLVESKTDQSKSTFKKLKTREVADFCREMAAMLASGVTLIKAMMIMMQRDMKPRVRDTYSAVIDDLQRGSTLSDSMGQRGRAFPELLINMMRAGESTGRMDVTALKMADNYDKEYRLNKKLTAAMIYPIILLFMLVAAVLIIFTWVIPQFMSMYENMELPLPTKIVLAISDFLMSNGILLIAGVVIFVILLIVFFRRPGPKLWLDKRKLHIPRVGKLLRTIYTARFARTLASLYVSGIPMIQAMTISRNIIGNTYIASQFDLVIESLGNGRTLSQSISLVDGFESKLPSTILIGEESGRLEQMLESVSDQYDYDAEMATSSLIATMEPVLIVLMAVIVGFVIISVMLPLYNMYSSIESGEANM